MKVGIVDRTPSLSSRDVCSARHLIHQNRQNLCPPSVLPTVSGQKIGSKHCTGHKSYNAPSAKNLLVTRKLLFSSMHNLLTVKETGQISPYSAATVYYLVQRGQLPAIQIGGRWALRRLRSTRTF